MSAPTDTARKNDPVSGASQKRRTGKSKAFAFVGTLVLHGLAFIAMILVVKGIPEEENSGVSMQLAPEPSMAENDSVEEEKPVVEKKPSLPPPLQEAAMPDLSPTPSQLAIPLPQPKLAHEFSEMTPEVPDLGLSWGEFWTEEVLEEETTEELVVFGAPSRGNRVVFVVDVSTSMVRVCGREGVEAVKSDLRRAIDQLEEGIQFNVICFGNVADGFSTQPVAATMGNKVLAHRFMVDYFTGKFTRSRTGTFGKKGVVNGIPYTPILPADVPFMKKTGGGSRYDLALVAAFQQKATTVYLLTDGAPSTTRKGLLGRLRSIPDSEILRTVVAAAKANYGKHLPAIHTVSVNGVGAGFLMEVSRQFGGRYRELKATSLKVSVPAQPGR